MKNKKSYLTIFGVFFLLSMTFLLAHGEEGIIDSHEEDMMSGFYGSMFSMGIFGWLFMILIIVALTLFIVWLVKQILDKK
jgi:hypothetical protein